MIIMNYYMAYFLYHMSYQPKTPIISQGPKAREIIWVEGLYGMWYEKSHVDHILQCVFLNICESWSFSEAMLDMVYDAVMSYYYTS